MIFCATLVSWYNSGSGTRPWPIPIINRFSFWIREQTSKSVTNSSVYAFDRRQKQEKWLAIKRKTRLLTVWRCCKLGIYLRRVYLKPKMFTFFTLFLSLSVSTSTHLNSIHLCCLLRVHTLTTKILVSTPLKNILCRWNVNTQKTCKDFLPLLPFFGIFITTLFSARVPIFAGTAEFSIFSPLYMSQFHTSTVDRSHFLLDIIWS